MALIFPSYINDEFVILAQFIEDYTMSLFSHQTLLIYLKKILKPTKFPEDISFNTLMFEKVKRHRVQRHLNRLKMENVNVYYFTKMKKL